MALILGGYKHLHFARLPDGQGFAPGEIVHITCITRQTAHSPDSRFSIPVTITEATLETRNAPLNESEEKRAGRLSSQYERHKGDDRRFFGKFGKPLAPIEGLSDQRVTNIKST